MSLATIRAAADYFGVPQEGMFGKCRLREYVHARFATYYVMRQRDGLSYPQIGRRFKKDHSTIIHGYRQAEVLLRREPDFAAFIVAQMALPKHSAEAAILRSPYKPWEPEAAPAPKPVWTLPVGVVPRLKPVPKPHPKPVWETIQLDSDHQMRLDQHGYTLDENVKRDQMIAASRRLAFAIQQARAA